MDFDYEMDVAIVGGGACGLMAALRAGENPDLSVVVFEKSTKEGCNTGLSSGSLAASGTRYQREAGFDDGPEQQAEEIILESGDESSREIVLALCRVSADFVHWLADDLDYPMELGVDMPRSGFSVPRLHADRGRQGGQRLINTMRDAVERRPSLSFVDNCPGTGLLVDDGTVIGLTIDEGGVPRRVKAREVVLAADGFGANRGMLEDHCPEIVDSPYGGVTTSTGDAIQWGLQLGGQVRYMTAFLGTGLMVPGHGTRVNPALPFLGALMVDVLGNRFVDETEHGYSPLGQVIARIPEGRAAIFWDEAAMRVVQETHLMRESAKAGAFRSFETLEEAAEAYRLPAEHLQRSLAELATERGNGPDEALRFPLYGAWITRGLLATQGGLVVDADGRVLRGDGSPIPGLSAGGGSAAGISGSSPAGYASGNGLLAAMGFGWLIGNRLAEQFASS